MRAKVYIETSIISYYTARPNRDLVAAARQEITYELWPQLTDRFDSFISALVIQEASRGDRAAAAKRLSAIAEIPLLEITLPAQELARTLVTEGAIPAGSEEDALHIAIACLNGMDFVLTWNFTHINNAFTKARIVRVIEDVGFLAPYICSPEELIGD
jgi:hypothetical protein